MKHRIEAEQIMNNKMDKEQLAEHQHIARKGGVAFRSKKDYRRNEKHRKKWGE